MHYAASSNINIQLPPLMGFAKTGVSEEQVKKRVGFTIRNYSRWLNNSDMTGMVLYADFAGSAGLQPVKNANGQRIEYYFTKQANQDPTINDTASFYPVTGDPLPLIPDPPSGDYFQYDEFLIDEAIVDGKKNFKNPVNEQSSILQFDENSQPQLIGLNDTTSDLNFVTKIWSKYYQTSRSKLKELNAIAKLTLPYTVPKDALNSINKAANIFEGQMVTDGRLSKEIIVDYLSKIGQIETEYKYKKQKTNKPVIEKTKFLARSYWQIEPRSAESLIKENLKTNNPLFGNKFETTFRKSYPKGNSVLEHLSTLSQKELAKTLENDSDLAATMAAADLITKLINAKSINI